MLGTFEAYLKCDFAVDGNTGVVSANQKHTTREGNHHVRTIYRSRTQGDAAC